MIWHTLSLGLRNSNTAITACGLRGNNFNLNMQMPIRIRQRIDTRKALPVPHEGLRAGRVHTVPHEGLRAGRVHTVPHEGLRAGRVRTVSHEGLRAGKFTLCRTSVNGLGELTPCIKRVRTGWESSLRGRAEKIQMHSSV